MKHSATEITLSNGTKGLFIDIPSSEVVDIQIYFRAGYQFGDFSKYEIPHLLEHHILNATKKHPKNNSIFVDIAKNGAMRNAFTGGQSISYWVECAEFELGRVFDLVNETLLIPTFPAEIYKTEKENVRTELTRNLSLYGRQSMMLNHTANYPNIGMMYEDRISQLDSISHSDVVEYYHKSHTALNGGFIITGAVNRNEKLILNKLEDVFGELPLGQRNVFVDEPGLGQKEPLLQKAKIDSNYYNISWYSSGGDDSEYAALSMLRGILVEGFGSRILGKGRDKGIMYSISGNLGHTNNESSFSFSGSINPDKYLPLMNLISAEVMDIVENGVTDEELDSARDLIIGGITLGYQTTHQYSKWYSSDYIFEGKIQTFDEYFELLRKVTPEFVQSVAKKIFLSPQHSSAYVGPMSKAEIIKNEKAFIPIWK